MSELAVQTIGLTRVFDKKTAVKSLDLSVEAGEFFGFLGPNGAGKSTTIKMIVGLLRPTKGQALIDGVDVWKRPLEAKARIGVVPEGLNMYERLSAREYIRLVGSLYGLDEAIVNERTEELLALMSLSDDADKLIIDYSQGMRKKTSLAAALIHSPRVLFLDEPFEGVDAISGRAIRSVLQQLRTTGTTIFFSSHILEVVERLCTRIAVISEGELVAQGTIDELRTQAQADDAEGGAATNLESIFLKAVGASEEDELGGTLSWL